MKTSVEHWTDGEVDGGGMRYTRCTPKHFESGRNVTIRAIRYVVKSRNKLAPHRKIPVGCVERHPEGVQTARLTAGVNPWSGGAA